MSQKYALKAQKRERAGKGIARSLRRENQVPAVIYGDNKAPVMISLPEKELRLEYYKGHIFTNLCELDVEGEKVLALARDIQTHTVTDKIESADFLRVGPNTKTTVEIPVHVINQDKCLGLKNKGVMNFVNHVVELRCPVTAIPDAIEVDVAALNIGDSIKLSEVTLPKGVDMPRTAKETTLVTIVAPEEYKEEEITAPTSDAEVAAQKAAAAGAKAPAKPAAKK